MSNDDRTYEREVREEPVPVTERESVRETGTTHIVRDGGSSAGWWVAALVAVIAIAGLFWFFTDNRQDVADLEAAREAGRAEAMMDNATLQAQQAAIQAQEASRQAAENLARSTQEAAESTRRTSEQAAASVGDAAQDASDTTVTIAPPRVE